MCLLLFCFSCKASAAKIALIIDDMGNTSRDTAAFNLPSKVAFSILPLTHLSKTFSRKAALQNREVMLHVPMESLAGNRLGPGALTSEMSSDAIRSMLTRALATVPDAIGVNNHMGSKLTQLSGPMNTTMQFLIEHQLFFVDSRTTRYSKAEKIAYEQGVMSLRRNVFLDHDASPEQINLQFMRLLKLAKKHGFAVGIAHPYPQTLNYLETALKDLSAQGVQLTTLRDLIQNQQVARRVSKSNRVKALGAKVAPN